MTALFSLDPQLAQDCQVAGDFPLCRVLLLKDANYPWFILVPKVAGITELHELDVSQQHQFIQESSRLSAALKAHFVADKINVAALGNRVRQLHIHHIARYTTDPAWPDPVWGQVAAKDYAPEAIQQRLDALCPLLGPSFRPWSATAAHAVTETVHGIQE